jgi:hypothetical protein
VTGKIDTAQSAGKSGATTGRKKENKTKQLGYRHEIVDSHGLSDLYSEKREKPLV